jgi:SAM-dependent methyltransferase
VLDIGCYRGEFLESLGGRIHDSVGIDPLAPAMTTPNYCLLAEQFKVPLPYPDGAFDAIVMLATIEHLDEKESIYRECRRL